MSDVAWWIVIACGLAVIGFGSYHAIRRIVRRWRQFPGEATFAEVAAGRLYRSGQLSREALERLTRAHGIRTIICLRASSDNEDRNAWSLMERAFCEDNQIDLVVIGCNHRNPPTDEQIDTFLKVASDPARQPALVHCKLGRQRTGLMAAIYRHAVEGATLEQTMAELDRFDFQAGKSRHRALAEVLTRTLRRLPPASATTTPPPPLANNA